MPQATHTCAMLIVVLMIFGCGQDTNKSNDSTASSLADSPEETAERADALQAAHDVAVARLAVGVEQALMSSIGHARDTDIEFAAEWEEFYEYHRHQFGPYDAWVKTGEEVCSWIRSKDALPTNAQIKDWFVSSYREWYANQYGWRPAPHEDDLVRLKVEVFDDAHAALQRYLRLLNLSEFKGEFAEFLPGLTELRGRLRREQARPSELDTQTRKYVNTHWR